MSSRRPIPLRARWRHLGVLLASLLMVWAFVPAVAVSAERRPVIGLVLSGGGALGATHIGVIKVLEELKVPVDIVVGTSMGSIVGGLYAMGLKAEELDGLVGTIDWGAAFEDRPPRGDRSFRRKMDDYGFLLDLKVGIKDSGIQFPPGLIQGQRLTLLLRSLTMRARSVTDFDRLPIRYRAVAADLETGREVVLSGGNIATAMRASMSVPGVFPPVDIDGKLLVDGGVANNLPVDVARSLGAEVVIVVDIPTVLKTRDKLKSTVDIAGQILSVLIQQNSLAQLRSLGPQDVLIQPELGTMSAADFGHIRNAVAPGEAAARKQAARLAALSTLTVPDRPARVATATRFGGTGTGRGALADGTPASGSGRWGGGSWSSGGRGAETTGTATAAQAVGNGMLLPIGPAPVIHFIDIDNRTRLADARIRGMIHQQVGAPLDIAQVDHDFAQLYGQGDFEQIDYQLVERNGRTGMVVTATEKSWAKDYFRVGLALEHDFGGFSTFTLGGSVAFTGLDAYGAEWRSELSIGRDQRLFTEYYQPLQPGPGLFVLPQLEFYQRNYYTYSGGKGASAQYRLTTGAARFLVGTEIGNVGMLAGGLQVGRGELERLVGTTAPADLFYNVGGGELLFIADTLDDLNFPSEGHLARATLDWSLPGLGADARYARLDVTANQAFSFGKTRVIIGGRGGTAVSGDLPIYDRFNAGGLFSVSGYSRNAISGENLLLGHVVVMQGLTETSPLALNLPLYVGGSLEMAATDDGGGSGLASRHYGGSLFAAAATPLGPVYLAYGIGDGGRRAGYLYLGKLF